MKQINQPKMIKLFVLGCLLGLAAAIPVGRIVNGTDAAEGEFPYIVSLRYFGSHTCGGSILDETHILTAAHCVYGSEDYPEYYSVMYGTIDIDNNKNVIDVSKIVYHENFNMIELFYDVAVLTLASPLPLGPNVQPTILPAQDDPTPENSVGTLSGWGTLGSFEPTPDILQKVDLQVYTDDDCETLHNYQTDRRYNVCAGVEGGGKGQCSGDSGGPLYANGVQVGIVSWSVKPCTIAPYPGVYAKVSSYVDWIKQNMI